MSTSPLAIVDFHNHHVPAGFKPTTAIGAPLGQRTRWEGINRRIVDEALLVAAIDSGDIQARVVNLPTALIADADGGVPEGTIERINDSLAALAARHPGRIHGLATVDAYAGESAARELTRSVRELGLRGVFVESAKGDLFIDAPEARPTLQAAAELGIPVFVHPVNPPLSRLLAPYGPVGTLYARGTVNSSALIALVEGGVLEALPTLKIVVTTLAIGGVLLTGAFGKPGKSGTDIRTLLRRQVHIDTMGFNPTLIRASIDLLGARNVLVGSDWPIVSDGPIRGLVEQALTDAGVTDEADRRLIAGDNTLRLLGVETTPQATADSVAEPA
ncbi:MAG: amidohydrolase family protein [Phreatobacter sp.]